MKASASEVAELGYSALPLRPDMRHNKWYRLRGKRILDITNEDDRTALEESVHYIRYALAIYTWYLYLFDRSVTLAVVNVGGW